MCESYSGWTNRETWAFMLHVNNDESLQDWAHQYVADYISDYDLEDGNRTYSAAQGLQWWAEIAFTRSGFVENMGDTFPDTLADIAEDIGSLYRINYLECAESMLSDMAITAGYYQPTKIGE